MSSPDWEYIEKEWGGAEPYCHAVSAYLSQALPQLALQEAFYSKGMDNNYLEMAKRLRELNEIAAEVLLKAKKHSGELIEIKTVE